MSTPHHAIAVIGAGLGGLTLARVLHVNGIDVAVFELEATISARDQGGMLDLHEESGQAALRAADLFDEFRAIVHPGGEAMRIVDKHGVVRFSDDGDDDGGRPEVNRHDLRRILLESLPENMIRWGVKVAGARPLGDGRHEVTTADGSTFTTDLLIGADGAWSKIRPLVSDAVPAYTGVSFVEADLPDAAATHPATAELNGAGMMFALGDEQGFLTHLEGDGTVHSYVAVKEPAEWLAGIDFTDIDASKQTVLQRFDGWDDRLRALVADAEGALVPRPIYALPVAHRWERTPGVTLLGDAAHVMSPFAGEGANLAMLDGAKLGSALVDDPEDVECALDDYEQSLFPRSAAAAAESAENLTASFSPDGLQKLIDQMAAYQDPLE